MLPLRWTVFPYTVHRRGSIIVFRGLVLFCRNIPIPEIPQGEKRKYHGIGQCRKGKGQQIQLHLRMIGPHAQAQQGIGDVPVLFLSARDEDAARLRGLGLGADDYITKPFLPQELLLRLRAVLRRVYREEANTARLGDMEIDWGKGTVRRNGRETALTAKEFALLKKLWEARGNIVTVDALCAALWDGPLVGYENTLMVHIRRLREKVEADPSHPQFLLTVRGLGYRLKREETP